MTLTKGPAIPLLLEKNMTVSGSDNFSRFLYRESLRFRFIHFADKFKPFQPIFFLTLVLFMAEKSVVLVRICLRELQA